MGKNVYVGVGSKARHVKDIYVGVNGVARRVIRGYVGVNGVARQFYAADWWRPEGVTASQVIGAWNFKKSSGGFAAIGSSYTSGTGWYVNPALTASISKPVTAVFRYSGMPTSQNVCFTSLDGAEMMSLLSSYNYFYNGSWRTKSIGRPAFCMTYSPSAGQFFCYYGNSTAPSSGVIGFDRSKPQIYVNGSAIGVSLHTNYEVEWINNLTCATKSYQYPIGGNICGTTIIAAAFYNVGLDATQQAELYKRMMEL